MIPANHNKELLTASRMGAFQTCPRRHYWRYEVGLRRRESHGALAFGSAWHRAMECRWKGGTPEEAWQAGADPALDDLALATFGGLLSAYFAYYTPELEEVKVATVSPEVEFRHAIAGSRTFDAAGKIDGLCQLEDGRLALIEHKTTSQSVSDNSDYWLRLRADTQIRQYVFAARASGWNVTTVLYDVVRKPTIAPANVPILDDEQLKVVLDNATGERVMLKNGKPRQSAGEGMTLQARMETAEEFGERLREDVLSRPDFYFARREVPILDDDLDEFAEQRIQVARMILDRRRQQKTIPTCPERAWPRYVNGFFCPGCEYSGFCLQNTVPDLNHPPEGFEITNPHEELEEVGQ